jgi:hypothetical protein
MKDVFGRVQGKRRRRRYPCPTRPLMGSPIIRTAFVCWNIWLLRVECNLLKRKLHFAMSG